MQDVVHKYLAVRGLQAHARDISMDQGQPYTFRPRHQGNLWLSMIEMLIEYILKRVDGLASFRLETFKIKFTEEDKRHSKDVEITRILRKQEG